METSCTGHLIPHSPENSSTSISLDTKFLLYFYNTRCSTVAQEVHIFVYHSRQVKESSSLSAGLCLSALITATKDFVKPAQFSG